VDGAARARRRSRRETDLGSAGGRRYGPISARRRAFQREPIGTQHGGLEMAQGEASLGFGAGRFAGRLRSASSAEGQSSFRRSRVHWCTHSRFRRDGSRPVRKRVRHHARHACAIAWATACSSCSSRDKWRYNDARQHLRAIGILGAVQHLHVRCPQLRRVGALGASEPDEGHPRLAAIEKHAQARDRIDASGPEPLATTGAGVTCVRGDAKNTSLTVWAARRRTGEGACSARGPR
jgi:hypothetical protein